jgi:hypothetical protein
MSARYPEERMRYEVIDQQWVATAGEADELEARLAPRAERYGFVIGRKPDRDGILVTVEKPAENRT